MNDNSNPSPELAKRPVRQRVRPAAPLANPPPSPSIPREPPLPVRERKRSAQNVAPPASGGSGEKVGYCNPPKHTQFKPGFDPRRPKGRKAGSKNKSNSIVAMMESPTSVRTPEGDVRTIPTAEAMARKLRELALSGHLPAIIKAFEFYHKALPPAPPEHVPNEQLAPETSADRGAADQAILAWYEDEVRARAQKASSQ